MNFFTIINKSNLALLSFITVKVWSTMVGNTAVLINENTFSHLTEGQVLTWRAQTYAYPSAFMKFTDRQMYEMIPIETLTLREIKESIKERMIQYTIQGIIKDRESVFVMVDSSTLGAKKLEDAIYQLSQKFGLCNKNIILIASHINKTENEYKMGNIRKYPGVDFRCMSENIALLNGQKQFLMDNVFVFQTDLVFDNKMLFEEEHQFLRWRRSWKFGDRNEINDNAQLRMLVTLNQMFSKRCFLISRDNKLVDKARCNPNVCGFFF